MWKGMAALGRSVVDLIYPPFCLHCEESMSEGAIFCAPCLELLQVIDPKERCPYCFSGEFDRRQPCCAACYQRTHKRQRMAAAFDYEGPAATLVKRMKYGGMPYLAKGAAAFLVVQFVALGWPLPDCVVPVPMDALKRLDRGYNQSALLAAHVADLLHCPMKEVLKRSRGSFSQAGLSHQQRLELEAHVFEAAPAADLRDKCILLIDDVMTTGSTLGCCAEALHALYPKAIYALTVCRAL